MKTLANSLLAAVLLSASVLTASVAAPGAAPAKPSDKNTVRMATTSSYRMAMFSSPQSPMKLKIVIEKQTPKSMAILVKDAEGLILGAQYLTKKTGSYSLKFNLENLTDGNYQVEIVSGDTKEVYPLTLSTEAPAVADRSISVE